MLERYTENERSSTDMNTPPVVILLSTYNGLKYLNEQLESLEKQDYPNIQVLVRDDGSTDGTQKLLEQWQSRKNGWMKWYQGENMGAGKSFLALLSQAPEAAYYAFCDQDDVWMPDKISAAVFELIKIQDGCTVYTSNVEFVDKKLKHLGVSRFGINDTILKGLLYNQAVGCTMVINRRLREAVVHYSPQYLLMHDCWAYRVCLALGGHVVFDSQPHIQYRQHEHNVDGGSADIIHIWRKRIKDTAGIKKNKRKFMAKELLNGYTQQMDKTTYAKVKLIAEYDNKLINKLKLLTTKDIYRGGFVSRASLVAAIICNCL